MATVGLLSTADIPATLAKLSFSGLITRLSPNGSTPLFGLTTMLKDETVVSFEHGYWTKTMIFPSVVLNGAIGDGTTTAFVVDSTADTVVGDLFMNGTTGENILITSVPNTTELQVRRGVGTVAAAAMADNEILYHIGNAFEQASLRPQAISLVATYYSNYTQIFRNSWAVSNTLAQMTMLAGDGAVAESKRDCALFHALAIEKALFFGQKFLGTRNGQPFHTMEGVVRRVTAAAPGNVTTLGGTTNWTQLEAAFDVVLNTSTDASSSNTRTAFVGGVGRRVLHNIARLNSSYQITTMETKWGLQLDTIRTPRGIFEIIEHRLFNAYGQSAPWAKMMIIMDLNAFSIGYLRKTKEKSYNEDGVPVDNGVDAQGGTLTTELTCLIKNPAAFGIIYNFTAAAAG